MNALILTLLLSQAASAASPKVVVVPPKGRVAIKAHDKIIDALNARLQNRVVASKKVRRKIPKKAPVTSKHWTRRKRIARKLKAKRLILLERAANKELVAYVYVPPYRKVKMKVRLHAVLTQINDDESAARLADVLLEKAGKYLGPVDDVEPDEDAEMQFDMGDVDVSEAPAASAEANKEKSEPLESDIEAELRREKEREKERAEFKTEDAVSQKGGSKGLPFFTGSVGFGGAGRFLSLEGALAKRLLPTEYGAIPAIFAQIRMMPLRLFSKQIAPQWSDWVLSASIQRGLWWSETASSKCRIDDDNGTFRSYYRPQVWKHKFAPRVGGGVSAGWERLEIVCDSNLEVLSTRYMHVGALVSVVQPLWPQYLELEALADVRFLLLPEGVTQSFPASSLEVWLNGNLTPNIFVRAGFRWSATSLTWKKGLSLQDARPSFGIELGVNL